jgi:hypothetical protein
VIVSNCASAGLAARSQSPILFVRLNLFSCGPHILRRAWRNVRREPEVITNGNRVPAHQPPKFTRKHAAAGLNLSFRLWYILAVGCGAKGFFDPRHESVGTELGGPRLVLAELTLVYNGGLGAEHRKGCKGGL